MIINGVTITIGTQVRFTTKHLSDTQQYRGTVTATCGYAVAQLLDKIAAIHANMPEEVKVLPLQDQDFIVVQTADGVIRPFAACWIEATSFAKIGVESTYTVLLRNITEAQLDSIVARIRLDGIDCEVDYTK